MDDALSLFEDDNKAMPNTPAEQLITVEMRQRLRESFRTLGLTEASVQFSMVEEITGRRIRSVPELEQRHAANLLTVLQRRIESLATPTTGDPWTDRSEDTWIDKL